MFAESWATNGTPAAPDPQGPGVILDEEAERW